MWKSLSVRKKWATYLLNPNGGKVFDRKEINELATKFSAHPYKDKNRSKKFEETVNNIEEIAYFLEDEIEAIMKNFKKEKVAGWR